MEYDAKYTECALIFKQFEPFVPEEYTIEDNVDKLERKLYQAYKLALKIISDIEKAEDNENESN